VAGCAALQRRLLGLRRKTGGLSPPLGGGRRKGGESSRIECITRLLRRSETHKWLLARVPTSTPSLSAPVGGRLCASAPERKSSRARFPVARQPATPDRAMARYRRITFCQRRAAETMFSRALSLSLLPAPRLTPQAGRAACQTRQPATSAMVGGR